MLQKNINNKKKLHLYRKRPILMKLVIEGMQDSIKEKFDIILERERKLKEYLLLKLVEIKQPPSGRRL